MLQIFPSAATFASTHETEDSGIICILKVFEYRGRPATSYNFCHNHCYIPPLIFFFSLNPDCINTRYLEKERKVRQIISDVSKQSFKL